MQPAAIRRIMDVTKSVQCLMALSLFQRYVLSGGILAAQGEDWRTAIFNSLSELHDGSQGAFQAAGLGGTAGR